MAKLPKVYGKKLTYKMVREAGACNEASSVIFNGRNEVTINATGFKLAKKMVEDGVVSWYDIIKYAGGAMWLQRYADEVTSVCQKKMMKGADCTCKETAPVWIYKNMIAPHIKTKR